MADWQCARVQKTGGELGYLNVMRSKNLPEDQVLGIVNPGDLYNRIIYVNRGKKGCSKIASLPPADRSGAAAQTREERIAETAGRILSRMRQDFPEN